MTKTLALGLALIATIAALIYSIASIVSQPSLGKSEYFTAALAHFESSAMLALKRATGVCGFIYRAKRDGAINSDGPENPGDPSRSSGILDLKQIGPGGGKFIGVFADLKDQNLRDSDDQTVLRRVNSGLPTGYTAFFFTRPSLDGTLQKAIIVRKVCNVGGSEKHNYNACDYQEPAQLDKTIWDNHQRSACIQMAETLIHQEALIGLNSAQLTEKLGAGIEKQVATGEGNGGRWTVRSYPMHYGEHGETEWFEILLIDDRVVKAWHGRIERRHL